MIREPISIRSPFHPTFIKEKVRLNLEGFVQEAVKKKADKKECLWHLKNCYETDKFMTTEKLEARINKLTTRRQDKVRKLLSKLNKVM